ncbi:MAG: hypothetical protein J6Q32_01300 [Clostridia bacterium]|nr:hypothetical protein [Clostridia bacterium]
MFKLKIADVVFGVHPIYADCKRFCSDFIYAGAEEPEFIIKIEKSDIEREKSACYPEDYPESYLETLALSRIFSSKLLSQYQGMLFHCSSVKYNGNAYLFTAPSGTGKSTHASYWKRLLGDKAVIINDDKPIIRRINGKFYLFGSPWNGKHHIGVNDYAPLKAICVLTRGEQNSIEKINAEKAIPVLLEQTVRPSNAEDMFKLLDLIDAIVKESGLYLLKCNIDPESAKVSFKGMVGEDYET